MLLKPNPANRCFGCGGANPRGMQLTFEQDDEAKRIRGQFRVSADYQGGAGFVHGGIVATLLDEVMAKVSRFREDHAVTAELTVEYLKPVPVDADLIIDGWEVRGKGAISTAKARFGMFRVRCSRAGEGVSCKSTWRRFAKSLAHERRPNIED